MSVLLIAAAFALWRNLRRDPVARGARESHAPSE
jgi:hypothetical protein